MLWGVSDGVMKALDDSKVIATIGRDNVFAVQPEIGASTGAALEAADAWIDAHRSYRHPRSGCTIGINQGRGHLSHDRQPGRQVDG